MLMNCQLFLRCGNVVMNKMDLPSWNLYSNESVIMTNNYL